MIEKSLRDDSNSGYEGYKRDKIPDNAKMTVPYEMGRFLR